MTNAALSAFNAVCSGPDVIESLTMIKSEIIFQLVILITALLY